MQKVQKTTSLIVLSGCFLFVNSALARVGETEAQIDHRYGKPAGRWDDYVGYKKLYHWHGYNVRVTFFNNVSQREMFDKVEGGFDPHVQKYLVKFNGVGRNGIIFDETTGAFTTKEFEEKYKAARTAAWAKGDEKH